MQTGVEQIPKHVVAVTVLGEDEALADPWPSEEVDRVAMGYVLRRTSGKESKTFQRSCVYRLTA